MLGASGRERESDVLVGELDVEPGLVRQSRTSGARPCRNGDPIAVSAITSTAQGVTLTLLGVRSLCAFHEPPAGPLVHLPDIDRPDAATEPE